MTRSRTPSSNQVPHADRLAEELLAKGSLRSPAWRHAFATVPRHLFVPEFHVRTEEGTVSYTDRTPGWLEAVYSDSTLITRFSPEGLAVSSSTEPSLMALMLEHLQVEDGMRVLEVGAGTGYNAGLLSERVGSALVTSIDRDPELVERAHVSLAAAGYGPTVAVADGAHGYPPNAPYDRILATCGLGRVPAPWLEQLTGSGLILANVGLGLARLHRRGDGTAHGRFLPDAAGFMRLRSPSTPGVPTPQEVLRATRGEPDRVREAGEIPGLDDHAMSEFLLSLFLPFGTRVVRHQADREVHCVLDAASGAWARAEVDEHGRAVVAEQGDTGVWDAFTELLGGWDDAGRPGIGRYGLTVSAEGRHLLWLDRPEGGRRWDLDPARTSGR
ncbi:methyltransferase domain-containing protein [Nocardiopsis sp. NPDC049922]|uniref:methyltransferase domain-containing protein n=1 Tax=Nocardiopsis sp. NPDC049922 TaxID=3155157 RepID=UPI0033FDD748